MRTGVAFLLAMIWLPLAGHVMFRSALGPLGHYLLLPSIAAVILLYLAAMRAWRGSWIAVFGLSLVCFWLLMAVAAPYLPLLDPNKPLAPFVAPGGMRNGVLFLLGSDMRGRDVLSRTLWGCQRVLVWGVTATSVAYVVGTGCGLIAGYLGGWWDEFVSFAGNVLLSFPVTVLFILVLNLLGQSGFNIIIAVTCSSAPVIMRIVRGLALDAKSRDYIQAAQDPRRTSAVDNDGGIAAQCARTSHRGRLPAAGLHHRRHHHPDLSRPGAAAAGSGLGAHDQGGRHGRPVVEVLLYVDRAGPGRVESHPGVQSDRRRPARNELAGMTPTPILECRDLSISYAGRAGDVAAVAGFNLTLMQGEAHGLVGESGCGKSSIALAIMRYLGRAGRVAAGRILFHGRDVLAMNSEELRRIRGGAIAMIYQEPMASLNPAMTIGEQLVEVPKYHDGVGRREAGARARAMLERVHMADAARIMGSYPHQISGGQQQRIVIAMALLSNPELLLLDEPTTALDVTVEAGIVELIRGISAEFGTSMLYISHNLGLVRETCDRVTVMYSGEAVETGPVAKVFRGARHPYTRGLIASLPVPGADKNSRPLQAIPGQLPSPRARPPGCFFGPRCAYFSADRCDAHPVPMAPVAGSPGQFSRCLRIGEIPWDAEPAVQSGRAAAEPGAVVLEVNALTKRFGAVSANDGLSFDARRGETVAIVGESGCGKSTFARILMGLTQADSGSAELDGLDLGRLPVTRRGLQTIRSLQMIFQNPFDTLNPSRTVGSQIARVIRKLGVDGGESRIREQVLELLDLVKLPREFAERRPRQLSGGQKQRVGVARAFAGHPSVVVADEPLSALDVSVQAAVTELLIDIQRRERTTLLFISHDLSVVRYLSDRVVVMYLGMIMEQGGTSEVFAPPYHPYTEALLASVPLADHRYTRRSVVLSGEIPSASSPPAGCRFSTRCPYKIPGTCDRLAPPLQEFSARHRIACHLPREQLSAMRPVFEEVMP